MFVLVVFVILFIVGETEVSSVRSSLLLSSHSRDETSSYQHQHKYFRMSSGSEPLNVDVY